MIKCAFHGEHCNSMAGKCALCVAEQRTSAPQANEAPKNKVILAYKEKKDESFV